VEWDILGVPAERNVKFYTCCDEPYLDITFNITMRRNNNTSALSRILQSFAKMARLIKLNSLEIKSLQVGLAVFVVVQGQ
jgi:S-adenosylmethionine/arginine decarboxylase-like enzyme